MSLRRRERQGSSQDAKTAISSIDDLQYLDAKHLVRKTQQQQQQRQHSYNKNAQTLWTGTLDVLVFVLMMLHILIAPYTKVEESFNLQATHDILHFGWAGSLDRSVVTRHFDHLEFPGVVPRTFVGPVLLAMASWPFLKIADWVAPVADVAFSKGIRAQVIVRLVLGAYTCFSWRVLRKAVQRQFGSRTAQLFMFVSACQFHWLYYAGRTLPNIFALGLVNIAYSHWLRASTPEDVEEPSEPSSPCEYNSGHVNGNGHHHSMNGSALHYHDDYDPFHGQGSHALTRLEIETRLRRMIDWLVLATVLFRSELLLLMGPILLIELITTRISFAAMVLEGLVAGLASLALGVVVDSWFWQKWMWTEGAVFWFNVVEGKSVAWGVSPWYTYFALLLPKILQLALPLGLAAFLVEPRYRRYLVPTLMFVGLYSCLGHKEWRFVVYVVPILNLGAALFLSWTMKRKPLLLKIFKVVCLLALLGTLTLSLAMSLISSTNYPGGHALARLHQLLKDEQSTVHVHIDGAAAETGCSRFGELYALREAAPRERQPTARWVYSKREDLVTPEDYVAAQFTHLLTAKPEFHEAHFEVVEAVQGYAGLRWQHIKDLQAWKDGCLAYGMEQLTPASVASLLAAQDGLVSAVVARGIGLFNACSPLRIHMEDSIWIMRRTPPRGDDDQAL